MLRFAGAAPLTARDEGAADIWSVVTRQTPRDDDGPTLDTIETWLEGQERLVTRAIPGPLDPDALQNASGRDVAAAIVQHAEIAPPTRAIEAPERGTRAPQRPPADVPFEEALVTLAENILSLPAGSPRTDPPHLVGRIGATGREPADRGLERTTCPPGGGKGGAMPGNQLTGDAPVSVDGITIDAPGLTGEVVVETGAGATRRGVGDQVPDQIRLAVRGTAVVPAGRSGSNRRATPSWVPRGRHVDQGDAG